MQPITNFLVALTLALLGVMGNHAGSNEQRLIQNGQFNPIQIQNMNSSRIVGGEGASWGEFPWIVLLKLDNTLWCAGSIINAEWIVTSALCAEAGRASRWTVLAGEHNIDVTEGSEQTRSVSEVLIHPDNSNAYLNDVALMKLSSPLTLNQYVAAAVLPEPDFSPVTNLVVAGWGQGCGDSTWYSTLQKLTVPLASPSECRTQWDSSVNDGNICAGGIGGHFSREDWGGPLHSGRTLVGIAIFSHCASTDLGMYSYVPFFLDWIRSNTNTRISTTL